MVKKDLVIIADYSQSSHLTLEELCEACRVSPDLVNDLIEYDIIAPHGRTPSEWTFDLNTLKRIQRALRINHDLDVNLQGVAILLDLLDEMEHLRLQVSMFEKHFTKL